MLGRQSMCQSRANSVVSAKYLFQASPEIQTGLHVKYPSKFGEKYSKGRARVAKRPGRIMSPVVPLAVLTTDPVSGQNAWKFNIDGNSDVEVLVTSTFSGTSFQIDIQVTNSSNALTLHWGGIRGGQNNWMLPSRRPDGTKVYKNKALRTPLAKSGSKSFIKIEVDDPAIKAIEFLIVDEPQNKWFKCNGGNFNVPLPQQETLSSNVSVPEDLVQIQAFLRWERKGKQMYTPEQEKEEYEAARAELLEEISRGITIDKIRERFAKSDDQSKAHESRSKTQKASVPEKKSKIPDDLVQIQAYIRWEKAGKPNYSPEQQLSEFEEARKDLQNELDKGSSLEEIRKKIIKGDIQSKVSKQKRRTVERIQRKKRDLMQLLNKHTAGIVEEKSFIASEAPTAIQLFSKSKEEQDGGAILNKKVFKLGDKELLALVTKPNGKTKVYLVTNFHGPLTLHWALSKNAGEWQVPPKSVLPHGSVLSVGACETAFIENYLNDSPEKVQSLEIQIDEENYVGIPFVLKSGENWIKNGGSDFYVDFSVEPKKHSKETGDGKGTAKALLVKIAELEPEAQKSFMHRFNIAADLMEWARDAGELGIAGILVWMRFMATRQLIWNKNYNVKPREISKAQDRLTDLLQNIYKRSPQHRELLRLIMSTVGRGGEGDVGQRIRDEILVIQRKNDCKGGMMEEWHQKLHNNTSPDDVVICQALIDYVKSDMDINVYWNTLNSNGITKERLLSYDRAIHSEPNFRRDQKEGLLRDLGHYLRTLKAVHSGADLESAIANCMGYKAEGEGFMVGVSINPISGLPSGYPELLEFVLDHVEDKNVEPLLEGLLEAREELRPLLLSSHDRLKDLLFLDLALDSTVRTAIERGYEELNDAGPEKIICFISLILENLVLSFDNNEDLIYCLKGWSHALNMLKSKDEHWALYAKSVLDRTRLALSSKSEHYQRVLQPSAEYLGLLLGVDEWAVSIFTEEIIRAGSAASLSSLLNRIDPVLRKTANLGSWQVISPVEVVGHVVVVDELLAVQNKSYGQPTILVAKSVKGEEEIPDGTVAVLTPDMPDVLSHVSVRARNSKVCFATCFDENILNDIRAKQGKFLCLKPISADIVYSEVKDGGWSGKSSADSRQDTGTPSLTLIQKKFCGRYAISSEEFTNEMVGAKSRNISYLKGKVPSWVGIPTSVALPFGVFEKVLSDGTNKAVAESIESLKKRLEKGDFNVLGEIRSRVLDLVAPTPLVEQLKQKMQSSGMPWPGDEGEQRWKQAWTAIKKVWASKWNERAYFSTRKVKLNHDNLCMAVLVQEIINADYAFVIHTTNPSSGDSSEIYAEVVRGLGETLVGAYPGRSLSFVSKKNDLNSPKVLGYPSKPIGLFIKRSIIFRSDSNGEDLEGYAGAGLYDSVPMDEEEKVVLDYSTDPLINDKNFCNSILSSIARAGHAIEELYGSPQDIEGVVRDGKIFVVQTRPQM
ncbi:hypothetical protein Sjap_016165 [Stephania japonica]|uniref:Pyruvate phosphate dikinase AMP/ATP-binding domain-containing protein n=1 Tax=Stephania japonica TaxID=461633 RepID=A0AAP0NS42_9MAGN